MGGTVRSSEFVVRGQKRQTLQEQDFHSELPTTNFRLPPARVGSYGSSAVADSSGELRGISENVFRRFPVIGALLFPASVGMFVQMPADDRAFHGLEQDSEPFTEHAGCFRECGADIGLAAARSGEAGDHL